MYLAFITKNKALSGIVLIILCVGYTSFLPLQSSKKAASGIKAHQSKTISLERLKECMNKTASKSIFYVKIQKTGSTSLKSSLFNYGMKYKLRICVDSTDIHHMNFPYSIDPLKLTKPLNGRCDIIADELIYNNKQVKSLMRDNAFIMASVRDPVTHFISMFKFARIQQAVHLLTLQNTDFWDSIRVFLKHPQLVRNVYATYKEENLSGYMAINLVRPNLQLFSLGLDSSVSQERIESRANELDFLVVAEKYSESMVILSKKLCCGFEDLVYVRQNIQRQITEDTEAIPEDIVSLIKTFNKGDVLLYDIAKKRLEKSIRDYKHFQNDLDAYNAVIKKYSSECETKGPLAQIDNNYCLQEGPTYFFKIVREKQKRNLLEVLQKIYEDLNE